MFKRLKESDIVEEEDDNGDDDNEGGVGSDNLVETDESIIGILIGDWEYEKYERDDNGIGDKVKAD